MKTNLGSPDPSVVSETVAPSLSVRGSAAHTPGPWVWSAQGQFRYPVLMRADGVGTFVMHGMDGGLSMNVGGRCSLDGGEITACANARLIAAAPDLYEALRGLIDVLPNGAPSHSVTGAAYRAAKAALTKAVQS